MTREAGTPTVSHIDGNSIVELVYDAGRQKTALIVAKRGARREVQEVELSSGETLIPYSATNNLIRHRCVLLPSEPVPSGGKEKLVDDVQDYIHRYVDLSPTFERIAAHYVLMTWLYDAFNEVPYLRFRGEYGSGKTRALLVVGSIAYKGFFASGASTVSPIFHTLDRFHPTLVLDEADLRFSDKTADLVKILNNGTVNGLPVLRTLQNRHKEFNPAAFTVFGPKIIAMRTEFRDQALESRFLTEEMGRRPLRPDIPIHVPKSLGVEALALRNRLLDFRLTNLATTKTAPERVIPELHPRFNQTALSLLSLVDDATTRQDIADALLLQQNQLKAARLRTMESCVVSALKSAFANRSTVLTPLRSIAAAATAIGGQSDNPITPRQAGQVLRTHGVALFKSHGTIVVRRADVQLSLIAD